MPPIPRWRLLAAFAAIYFIWGSSYLAIRIAIETIPPLLGAGVRFTVAGLVLLGWAMARGIAWPKRTEWKVGIISGVLLFLIANGSVVWVSRYVPSSMVALTNATIPLWVVLADWLFYRSARPGITLFFGLLLGLGGMALLLGPGTITLDEGHDTSITLILLAAPVFWAVGSLMSRRRLAEVPPLMTTGIQLLSGGVLLLVIGSFTNELTTFRPDLVSWRSLMALAYLTFASSVITFTAFIWLMKVDTPARASTYAFVNPVFALFLGVVLAGEPFGPRTLVAALVILTGVLIITYHKQLEGRGRVLLATLMNLLR